VNEAWLVGALTMGEGPVALEGPQGLGLPPVRDGILRNMKRRAVAFGYKLAPIDDLQETPETTANA
jgi:hypothetical protein